ncbi:minichromosome maintenance MCM2/3/5 family protein [Prunus dulcis]|uniref:Minichromosome maintenance MCM2/3/5 family protein n=1 Tax=Prunus dulcis TaxID=3755 RepID=A0A4Y1RY58_PRUDU|nr:minichromosome maintenance MCM2/3/5 family protein [Prunus dulcis]
MKMKAKLKPSKTHHGPQTWKHISSPPIFRRARILISLLHKKGGRIQGKRTGAINIGTPSLLINLYLQDVAVYERVKKRL